MGYNNNYKSGGYGGNRNNNQGGRPGGKRNGPKATYPSLTTNPFLNPYNFVPTTATSQSVDAQAHHDTVHTGYLDCRLIARTPLAIPDVQNSKKSLAYGKEHDVYPFMSVNGKRMIPGSSIRGVIRNIYETATDSCMVTIAGDDVITARMNPNTVFSPGILKKGKNGWLLYPARRIAIVGRSSNSTITIGQTTYAWGDPVYLADGIKNAPKLSKPSDSDITKKGPNDSKAADGYIFVGEPFGRKKRAESIFVPEGKTPIPVDARYVTALDNVHETYNNKAINRNAVNGWYNGYEKARNNGIIPLWYQQDGDRLYLSLAAIGRKAYDNTLSDIHNVRKPCSDRGSLCKACALFGMVGKTSLGSSVRFTDAVESANVEVVKPVLLKELGSPKPSYLPFYTVGGKDYDDAAIEIRGRKFYWHIPDAATKPAIYTGTDASRSAEFETARPGSEFTFRVYYDRITDEQLSELVWALTLGENDNRDEHAHLVKIGHGKPLGLGSAKVLIIGGAERSVDLSGETYRMDPIDDNAIAQYIDKGYQAVKSGAGYDELMTITDYDATKGCEVRYPYIVATEANSLNDAASHKWFSANRGSGKYAVPGLLPDIGDAMQQPLYPRQLVYSENSGGFQSGNRQSGGDHYRSGGNNRPSGNNHYGNQNNRRDGRSGQGGNGSFGGYRPIKPKTKPGQ